MNTKTLNDRLVFAYPEGFHEMSSGELGQNKWPWGEPALALSDPDRHMKVTGGFRTINGFSALVLNEKDVAKRMKEELGKALRGNGEHFDEFVSEKIGSKEAMGWVYGYTVQDTGMMAKSLVVKEGKELWYLHFYYRAALSAESLPVIAEMLENSSWK